MRRFTLLYGAEDAENAGFWSAQKENAASGGSGAAVRSDRGIIAVGVIVVAREIVHAVHVVKLALVAFGKVCI